MVSFEIMRSLNSLRMNIATVSVFMASSFPTIKLETNKPTAESVARLEVKEGGSIWTSARN